MTISPIGNKQTSDLRLQTSVRNFLLKSEVWSLKSAQGFTFIELVFVTLALGVLVVSVLPGFRQTWAHLQEERTAFQIAQSLRSARVLAIAQGQPIAWIWEGEAHRMWLGTQQDDGTAVPVPGRWGAPRVLPEGVTLTVTREQHDVSRVSFFPDGTSQLTTLMIGSAAAAHYQIAVHETTGHVELTPAGISSS